MLNKKIIFLFLFLILVSGCASTYSVKCSRMDSSGKEITFVVEADGYDLASAKAKEQCLTALCPIAISIVNDDKDYVKEFLNNEEELDEDVVWG